MFPQKETSILYEGQLQGLTHQHENLFMRVHIIVYLDIKAMGKYRQDG